MNNPKYVAVKKSHDHRVLHTVGPFDEIEDAARYANERQSDDDLTDYWIVSTLIDPATPD